MRKSLKIRALGVTLLEKTKIRRVLGVWELFSIGYGDLGSSIYYALGITASFALGATPLAMMCAGLVFLCTTLSYAELSSVYHESGGSASFARHAFNDIASFVAGWGLLFDYLITIAISAFSVVPYLAIFLPFLQTVEWRMCFACGIICLLYFLNVFGIKRSTKTNLVFAILAIATQVLIVGVGCFYVVDFSESLKEIRIGVLEDPTSPSWEGFIRGVAMAMVAYTGIESIAQLGSESIRPAKNLPRSMWMNMIFLIVLYFGITLVALAAVTPEELGTVYADAPIAAIGRALPIKGEWLSSWIGLMGASLLFIAANAGLIGSSRVAYNMGEYYQLPKLFSHIHPKFRTPHIALLTFALLAIALLCVSWGRLDFLANLYNFGAMIAFFSTNLSLIVLRIKQPMMKRPFFVGCNIRCCGYLIPISAIVGCLATFSVWIMIVWTKAEGRVFGLSWMAIGLVLFFIYRRKKELGATSIAVEKIRVPALEPLQINRILVSVQSRKELEPIQVACEIARQHRARLLILYVMEVPFSVSVDASFPLRTEHAEIVVKQAEAIARQWDIPVDKLIIRGRFFHHSLFAIVKAEAIDLVIAPWRGKLTKRLIDRCPCRVWSIRNAPSK
jgi:APA family basic amino acid/polyamine antiporter